MNPLFTPYGDYALVISVPSFGEAQFSALYSAWRFDRAINHYEAVLQGSVKGVFGTEAAAREAALDAARKALDALPAK